MGCSGSKEVDEKELRKIKSDFKETKVAKFDDFFKSAAQMLENAEKIREGLQDAREDGQELTDTWKLKNYEYTDVVRVLFWSLSANAKGNIKGTKVGVMEEAPFVHLDYFDGLLIETREVADSFESFLKSVTEGPKAIVEIVDGLQKTLDQGNQLKDTLKDDLKNSGLNPLDQAKAGGAFGSNLAKLAKEIPKVKTLAPLVQEAAKDVKALVPKFKEIYNTCDEVGAKAYKEGNIKPKPIFEHYHPGEKKTQAEIEAEKKAEEEKKGAKKAKKDEKKKDEKKKDEKKKDEKKPEEKK